MDLRSLSWTQRVIALHWVWGRGGMERESVVFVLGSGCWVTVVLLVCAYTETLWTPLLKGYSQEQKRIKQYKNLEFSYKISRIVSILPVCVPTTLLCGAIHTICGSKPWKLLYLALRIRFCGQILYFLLVTQQIRCLGWLLSETGGMSVYWKV